MGNHIKPKVFKQLNKDRNSIKYYSIYNLKAFKFKKLKWRRFVSKLIRRFSRLSYRIERNFDKTYKVNLMKSIYTYFIRTFLPNLGLSSNTVFFDKQLNSNVYNFQEKTLPPLVIIKSNKNNQFLRISRNVKGFILFIICFLKKYPFENRNIIRSIKETTLILDTKKAEMKLSHQAYIKAFGNKYFDQIMTKVISYLKKKESRRLGKIIKKKGFSKILKKRIVSKFLINKYVKKNLNNQLAMVNYKYKKKDVYNKKNNKYRYNNKANTNSNSYNNKHYNNNNRAFNQRYNKYQSRYKKKVRSHMPQRLRVKYIFYKGINKTYSLKLKVGYHKPSTLKRFVRFFRLRLFKRVADRPVHPWLRRNLKFYNNLLNKNWKKKINKLRERNIIVNKNQFKNIINYSQ